MKKGFTLVEMVAVLVILSIVAIIVTPNIYVSIRDYKNKMYETQLDNIKQATKNWAVDYINHPYFPTSKESSLIVTIQDLQKDGYIEDNLENPRDGGTFDNSEVFTLITCDYIIDETNNLASNYKYDYHVYENKNDYITSQAILYANKKKYTANTTITVNELKNEGYIVSKILYTDGNELNISNDTINLIVTKTSDEVTGDPIYEYSASIN